MTLCCRGIEFSFSKINSKKKIFVLKLGNRTLNSDTFSKISQNTQKPAIDLYWLSGKQSINTNDNRFKSCYERKE